MKNSTLFTFSILIIASVRMICAAQEVLDVETLPNLRTKQYSIAPYHKIVIFSAPRTGSSLTYNIVRFLFEEDAKIYSLHDNFSPDRLVLKTHKFAELDLLQNDDDVLYIFTIRDPLQASISNYRICTRKITKNKEFGKELINRHRNYLTFSETIKKEGRHVVLLRYEDFVDDFDFLLKFLENQFLISIAPEDKELMRKGYSKQNIYACTKHLADFKECLPISGFHGKHIKMSEYAPPKDFLYWLNVYLEDIKPLFRKYGYFLDPDHLNPVDGKR